MNHKRVMMSKKNISLKSKISELEKNKKKEKKKTFSLDF